MDGKQERIVSEVDEEKKDIIRRLGFLFLFFSIFLRQRHENFPIIIKRSKKKNEERVNE